MGRFLTYSKPWIFWIDAVLEDLEVGGLEMVDRLSLLGDGRVELDGVDRDLRDEVRRVDVAQVLGDGSVVERPDDAHVGEGLRILDGDHLLVGRLVERCDTVVVGIELELLEELALRNDHGGEDPGRPRDAGALVGRQDPDLEGFAALVDDVLVLADRASGRPERHDADRLLAGQRPEVQVGIVGRLRPGHDLRAVEVEVDRLDVLGRLRLETLEAGDDLLGDRQKRDRRRQQADVPDLADRRLAVRAGGGDLGRRRVRLFRHGQALGDAPLGVLVAVGDLEDELVVAGVEIPAHRERDLFPADLGGRNVEAILEIVDQPFVLDDFADDVHVVEGLFAQRPGLQLRLRHEQREVHADLVGPDLGETDELLHAERDRVHVEIGRHREDLLDALGLDLGRRQELARSLEGEGARRPERPTSTGGPAPPCATRSSA